MYNHAVYQIVDLGPAGGDDKVLNRLATFKWVSDAELFRDAMSAKFPSLRFVTDNDPSN